MTTKNFEDKILVNGVNARMTIQSRKPEQAAGLWFKQEIVTEARPFDYYGDKCRMTVTLRFDDQCGNGHNSFAITAEIIDPRRRGDDRIVSCGCLHDEIRAVFPELAPLITWHLCSTDSPMHYLANTMYHASDRDHKGLRKGEPSRFETRFKFNDFPISFTPNKVLADFLKAREGQEIPDFELVICPMPHKDKGKKGEYQFADKYSFAGCEDKGWTYAPFNSVTEAEEWREAIKGGYSFASVAVEWSEGKERNFEAARSCGVWPDATDEQLSAEPEELKAMLLERLPALQAEMKAAIEGAGFSWASE